MKPVLRVTLLSVLLMILGELALGAAMTVPQATGKVVLYASVGPDLTVYDVNKETGALVKRSSLSLPATVQEAAVHPSKRYLYVAWSNGGPNAAGDRHGLTTFRINPTTGDLQVLGAAATLPSRPIHVSTDTPGEYVLVAFNQPSGLTVHKVASDGVAGAVIQPSQALDFGIYAHQVRVDSSNKTIIIPARGNAAAAQRPEEPGSIRVFSWANGQLSSRGVVAPGGGLGFSPRHVEFDPSGRWVFVTLERENKLVVFGKRDDGSLTAAPLFTKDTLQQPGTVRAGQSAGSIHIHPNGRFLYTSNRATGTTDFEGKPVFAGGENAIAVFSINSATGEPTLIQNIETRGIQPRTFALDAAGTILIAGNQVPMQVREGATVRTMPAGLTVYRVQPDGRLQFLQKTDIPDASAARALFWVGVISLP